MPRQDTYSRRFNPSEADDWRLCVHIRGCIGGFREMAECDSFDALVFGEYCRDFRADCLEAVMRTSGEVAGRLLDWLNEFRCQHDNAASFGRESVLTMLEEARDLLGELMNEMHVQPQPNANMDASVRECVRDVSGTHCFVDGLGGLFGSGK